MWETRPVQITVLLPHDIAEQAEEVQKTDPEFLSRVVLYGVTRRSIYHQLRQTQDDLVRDGMAHAFGDDVRPIPEDEQRAILAEQGKPGP